MKKLILIILGLALAGGLVYWSGQKRPDETKTQGLPAPAGEPEAITTPLVSEDDSLTTIDSELSATELEDFDQEIEALDESINQL